MSRPSSSSSSSSRGEHRQVTLPPIRQIFGEELGRPVPHPTRSSPPYGRMQLEEDPRYKSRGASSPAPHGYASGTSRSYSYPDCHQVPSPHPPRGSSDPALHPPFAQNMPPHSSAPAYSNGYTHQYAQSHHPRTPIPTGSYPYSGSHAIAHSGMVYGQPGPQHQPYPGSETTSSDRNTSSRYECSYCGKGFTRPSSLKIHLNTHTGEKPFTCPHEGCGRSFSVQSNMRRHARVHTRGMEAQGGDLEDDGDSASEE